MSHFTIGTWFDIVTVVKNVEFTDLLISRYNITYGELNLSKPIHTDTKSPLYITWEVTLQCNANCIQCYSAARTTPHPDELSTEEAFKVIDEVSEAGLIVLAFSGGEPLMRPDIFHLLARGVSRGLLVNIATNGTSIDRDVAKRLKEIGIRSVTVSIDGSDAATHDNIRRYPGLFDKAVNAVRILVDEDVRVGISFTPINKNYHQGPQVVKLAHKLGASAINLSEYVPSGRGTKEMEISANTLNEVISHWIEMRREYTGRLEILWHDCRVALLVPEEERELYFGCGAARTVARIKMDGTVTPCVFLSHSAGNLKEMSFREIWDNAPILHTLRNRDNLQEGNCGSCDHKYICGGCRAVSFVHYGNLLGGDPSCWVVPTSECDTHNNIQHEEESYDKRRETFI